MRLMVMRRMTTRVTTTNPLPARPVFAHLISRLARYWAACMVPVPRCQRLWRLPWWLPPRLTHAAVSMLFPRLRAARP